MNLTAVLEGLLFVVGDAGLDIERIKVILDIPEEKVMKLIEELKMKYNDVGSGIQLEILGNNYKLTTKKEHKEYYEKLVEVEKDFTLSQASLETLAIIAYNEPVTRAQIDEIRGINCSHILRKLVLRNLIKDMGRSDGPGRPILYGVTDQFLDYFGLSNINELPKLEEIQLDEEEKNLFQTKYHE